MSINRGKANKLCLVTIGATADFDSLIRATLDAKFLNTLRKANYTHLRLQHGRGGKKILDDFLDMHEPADGVFKGLSITGFDFKSNGLVSDMSEARGSLDNSTEGVVISHAGTSISPFSPTPLPNHRP